MITARDVMSRHIMTIPFDSTILEASKVMAQKQCGSLLVIENNMPAGIITETDITRRVVAQGVSRHELVHTIMSSPLYTCSPDADITEIASAMTSSKFKKVPVMEGGEIVGIVTQTDLVTHVFDAVHQLEAARSRGHISDQEYVDEFSNLFHEVKDVVGAKERDWYMRCADCGNQFLNPEIKGELNYQQCPSCRSNNIGYDPNPPL